MPDDPQLPVLAKPPDESAQMLTALRALTEPMAEAEKVRHHEETRRHEIAAGLLRRTTDWQYALLAFLVFIFAAVVFSAIYQGKWDVLLTASQSAFAFFGGFGLGRAGRKKE